MNDAGQFGALLPNLSGTQASGRSITGRGDSDSRENAGSDGFGKFFDATGNRRSEADRDAAGAGQAAPPKRGEVIENDQDGLIADPSATNFARDASADELLGFNLQFPGGPKAQYENYFQTIQGRINDGDFNRFVKLPDSTLTALQAGDAEFRQNFNTSLATIKLTETPVEGPDGPLNTVKLSQAAAVAGGNSAFGNFAQFGAAPAEVPPNAERLLEFRPTLAGAGAGSLRATTQSAGTQVIAAGTSDAYNILSASFIGAVGGPSAAGEIDILADLALATSSGSARVSSGPALFAPSNAQSFAGFSGVLPQIQAAVIAGNGRDTVEVRLDPPDLGRVRIDFSVEGGDTIRAIIGADRSETLDHLRRNIADLEQQLRQAGFGSISFEFRSGGDRRFASDRDDPQSAALGETGNGAGDLPTKIYLTMRENAQLDLLL